MSALPLFVFFLFVLFFFFKQKTAYEISACLVGSVLLSVELFGSAGAPYFAVACALSYLLSGYCGLYSSQTILYSKLRAEFINVRTHE